MATSLFSGASPEEMQNQLLEQRAHAFAQQTQEQRLGGMAYKAGANVGTGLAQSMGVDVTDPMIKMMQQRRSMLGGVDQASPQSWLELAKKLSSMKDFAGAQEAVGRAQALNKAQQESTKTTAEIGNLNATAQKHIYDTSADARIQQLLATGKFTPESVAKYAKGFGNEGFGPLVPLNDKAEAASLVADAKVDSAKLLAEAKVEEAIRNGATQKEIAQMRIDGQRELRMLVTSLKGPSKLAVGLQKSEDEDLAKINSGIAQQETFTKPLESLKVNPQTGVPLLQLGPVANQAYKLANATGRSTPASRAFEQFQAAITEATNIKTDAAKGVQTDSDVLRQANGLITAFGKNDNVASVEALTRFNASVDRANDRTKKIIEDRRKSQNVDSYYGAQPTKPAVTAFDSPSAAISANLPKGTQITINGRRAIVE